MYQVRLLDKPHGVIQVKAKFQVSLPKNWSFFSPQHSFSFAVKNGLFELRGMQNTDVNERKKKPFKILVLRQKIEEKKTNISFWFLTRKWNFGFSGLKKHNICEGQFCTGTSRVAATLAWRWLAPFSSLFALQTRRTTCCSLFLLFFAFSSNRTSFCCVL